MTLAHYGKRRRGTAGITGRQRRVPEKPYWEEIKEDEEDPKETVGGKPDSPPSTPTKKSPKKRAQILETKSPSASTLSRRSRRRKRPRNETEEGTEAFTDCLTKLSDVGINFEISGSPLRPRSSVKNGEERSLGVSKLKESKLDSENGKNDEKKELQPQEIQNEARDKLPQEPDKQVLEESSSSEDRENRILESPQESAPIIYQELLGQLPRLENMLSGIHVALKLQAGSLEPLADDKSEVSPTNTEAVLEMHRAIEARQEESIRKLEALCEKQSKAFDELVKKTEIMQANHEKEQDVLSKEVETLRAVAKGFEKQQSSNNALLKKMEKLEARLSDKQEEQQNFSEQLLEMASNSKKQDIFLLERNVKIQELTEASNTAKSKYEGRIRELSIALRKSEAKVLELETENQQFKNMLDSFEASLTSNTSEPSDSQPSSQLHKTSNKQAKSPSTAKTEASSSVTKRETRSAKKASATRPLSLEHANIIELPASPFDAMGRFKGNPPSRTKPSPSRSKSSPSRSRSKKTSSSSNSIGSSSTGRRRRYTKVPVPTFDSLSGLQPGEDVVRVDSS